MSIESFAKKIVETATATPAAPRPGFIPTSVIAALCAGQTIVTKSQLAAIKEADTKVANLIAFQLDHIDTKACDAFVAQQKSIFDRVAAGKGAEVHEEDAWTRQDWEEDFRQKRKGMSLEINRINATLAPIVVEVAAKVAALAKVEAEKIKASEDALAGRFGVEHRSSLRMLLAGIAAHPQCVTPDFSGGRPKAILESFGIKID